MARRALVGCLGMMLWSWVAQAQEPPDPIFWDGFDPCPAGTGECDGSRATSCETPLDTTTDCGGCGVVCDFANASESCGTGTCMFEACSNGFANCDGTEANGCEVLLSGHSNQPPGEALGMHDADSAGGVGCPSLGCSLLLSRTGVQGRFFNIRAREGSNCCAYIGLRFELIVPPGSDYDLYVTDAPSCDPLGCVSTNGVGQNESLSAWSDDDCLAADNSFTVQVEVRHQAGTTCQPWQLRVYRRAC